nr:hypothetical protein [uncultured bacterium]
MLALFFKYINVQLANAEFIKSIGLGALFMPPIFSGSSARMVKPLTFDSVYYFSLILAFLDVVIKIKISSPKYLVKIF